MPSMEPQVGFDLTSLRCLTNRATQVPPKYFSLIRNKTKGISYLQMSVSLVQKVLFLKSPYNVKKNYETQWEVVILVFGVLKTYPFISKISADSLLYVLRALALSHLLFPPLHTHLNFIIHYFIMILLMAFHTLT